MSFGLPAHLTRSASSHALAQACRYAALICLASALAMVLLIAASGADTEYGGGLWPTVIALVPMMALLVTLGQLRTALVIVLYLVVGALGTLLYALTLLSRSSSFHDTRLFLVALPLVAMVLVGGAGRGVRAGVLFSTVGLGLGEAAVFCAATIAGRQFSWDPSAPVVYIMLVVALVSGSDAGCTRHSPQAAIHRAVRDVQFERVQHQLAVQLASDLHDEVLSDLAAIATAQPGPLSPRLRRSLERDLNGMGVDAVGGRTGASTLLGRDPWQSSSVYLAIEQSIDDGLSVRVSGNTRLLADLTPEQDRALGLATRQCLVNVLRHAGVTEADVAISGGDGDVSVMVVDAGHGFAAEDADEEEAPSTEIAMGVGVRTTGTGRLGLRASVSERIRAVGGSVMIWSNPGVGTTVVLEIPGRSEA